MFLLTLLLTGLGAVAQPGRALAWHARGQGFKSPQLHFLLIADQFTRLISRVPL